MTGPLAQEFAQLRSFRDFIPDWNDGPTGLPEEFDATVASIERHVQKMEAVLREVEMYADDALKNTKMGVRAADRIGEILTRTRAALPVVAPDSQEKGEA